MTEKSEKSPFTLITIYHLFSGKLPTRPDIRIKSAMETYKKMLIAPFEFYQERDDYILRGIPLPGKLINDMMYIAAPSKIFGLDTNDIIKDWTDLFEYQANANRLKAHRQIPGWDLFEKGRIRILGLIKEEAGFPSIRPIIRITKKSETISWRLEDTVAGIDISAELILGLLVTTIMSPKISTSWHEHQSYNTKTNNPAQNIGPTQILPLIIRESGALLESKLIKLIVNLKK